MELVHNGRPWLLSIITDMWFTVLPQRVVVCRESTTVKMDYTGKKGSGGVRGVGWLRFGIVVFLFIFWGAIQAICPRTASDYYICSLFIGGICLLPKYSTVLHSLEPCQKQPFICKKTSQYYYIWINVYQTYVGYIKWCSYFKITTFTSSKHIIFFSFQHCVLKNNIKYDLQGNIALYIILWSCVSQLVEECKQMKASSLVSMGNIRFGTMHLNCNHKS